MSTETLLAWWTGLALVAPGLDGGTLVGTALLLHLCHAILCRVFAVASGRSPNAWTAIGAVGGVVAVMLLIVLGRAPTERPVR